MKPDYDPKRDGNRFVFILRTAQAIRQERQARREVRPLFTDDQMALIRKLDRDLDDEELDHFARLRANQRARKAT